MSELAFNLNGEPFEVPSAAVGWRVRRMKPKGAPEVVYSRDGVPLILPIDADIDDLRRAARSDGRYRLDPVDEQNRMVPAAPAGYVCVQPSEELGDPAPLASRASSDNVSIEAMRMNTELAKTIIDRFPMMMEAAAALLRAADGAGLPARQPRQILEDENDSDDDELNDEPTDGVAPKATGLQGWLETLAPFVMPAVMNAIAGGHLKIPGGVGALLDCRRASPKARAAAAQRTTHEPSKPGAVPAPGPRDPAPAPAPAMSGSSSRAVTSAMAASASRAVPSPASPAYAPSAEASPPDALTPEASLTKAPPNATIPGDEPLAEPIDELPTLDGAALAHFAAIQNALTFKEGMLARALAAELSPVDLRTWFAELRQLTVPEAVTKIRALLSTIEGGNDIGGAP